MVQAEEMFKKFNEEIKLLKKRIDIASKRIIFLLSGFLSFSGIFPVIPKENLTSKFKFYYFDIGIDYQNALNLYFTILILLFISIFINLYIINKLV